MGLFFDVEVNMKRLNFKNYDIRITIYDAA